MAELSSQTVSPFLLTSNPAPGPGAALRHLALRSVESLSGLRACEALYERIDVQCPVADFPHEALALLGADYACSDTERARIPASGPCVLIANHPFGGVEGLILMDLIARVRPDFKVMSNYLLARIPQLRERLICVDPFDKVTSTRANLAPLREALDWLTSGGLLVIFPAGEVSSWQAQQGEVTDPAWSTTLARLVRRSKAAVVPAFFPGQNGALFQLAGRIHPRLRTLLLPRMLLNKRDRVLKVRIGNPIPHKKLAEYSDQQQLTNYLRLRTYALGLTGAEGKTAHTETTAGVGPVPLLGETPRSVLCREIAQLGEAKRLLSSGEFDVVLATGDEAPALLREIGRLRELTFREVGEGTGKCFDLDRYDKLYEHLFIWNREEQEIVGAYRVGRVDRLLETLGRDGLYATTLFDFQDALLGKLGNALELGRSFVRPEYQRSYAPLLLLWKGIGAFLVRNPRYRYLFGPVSISNDYGDSSRQLMTSTLARHYQIDALAGLVKPRLPVSLSPVKIGGVPAVEADSLLSNMEEISDLIADIELDNKGIPVLLRHYLGLGGKLLAFNLDPAFSNVIDGLILVDLQGTDQRQLRRYMGKEGLDDYLSAQQNEARCA